MELKLSVPKTTPPSVSDYIVFFLEKQWADVELVVVHGYYDFQHF